MRTRAYQSRRGGRRGVILILVLGVLGLMAVIGVTFATFTGQSRIAGRSFAQSKLQPQGDELMEFALAQLICDTNDIRSAIRGHSLARDMYGNDASRNGYLENRSDGAQMAPGNDSNFYVTRVDSVGGNLYALSTNITAGDPLFYGYNFNRWTIRIASSYVDTSTTPPTSYAVNQSFEVVGDTGYVPGDTTYRILTVVLPPSENYSVYNPSKAYTPLGYNASLDYQTATPARYLVNNLGTNLGAYFRFSLDSRWMHAFNGPGMTTEAKNGNFRYNTLLPAASGMDEDYDAVDLENWFLAMQSADGQVIIPSFHRPAAVRYDPAGIAAGVNINLTNDWSNAADLSADQFALRKKISRILRPRQADGHDSATFPDLIPSDTDGKITYDVDNDGDGISDSVWVDLGYPARRNAQGNLFKPLFAFMVIGLNGRIPLNTAGNLAGRGDSSEESQSTHASHLGNSVSEIDPTYGLQNAWAAGYGQYDDTMVIDPMTGSPVANYIDVRLTQLRNILAGTRPQIDPSNPDLTGQVNGDRNAVLMGVDALGKPKYYYMPNSVQDLMDVQIPNPNDSTKSIVVRRTPSVVGRWGEPDSVPGGEYAPILANYQNEVRPGYSISVRDLLATSSSANGPTPADAADDNSNSFDIYPNAMILPGRLGEVGDGDFYDAVGGLMLPVERIRRFLAPIDVNGSGLVTRFNSRGGGGGARSNNLGGDYWGRVEYRGYFRPPGLPGQVDPATGVITYPWSGGDPFPRSRASQATVASKTATDNNFLHGYDSFLFPNTRGTPQRSGGMLAYVDLVNGNASLGTPKTVPSYNGTINSGIQENFDVYNDDDSSSSTVTINSRSDGLNEADELNLYNPDANLDAPFTHADLEWLYRSHDVDGSSLVSRLSQLAPVSFTNDQDSLRRRRLYSIDTWESNAFAWGTDNPQGAFLQNHRLGQNANGSMASLGANFYTPALAQRGRKINLNMPLPVSNNPDEPIRNKWISDSYQLMKTLLPPRAVDTPEELAQLGQYLVNVIDFRDPDSTMTHWQNPDVYFIPVGQATPANTQPILSFTNAGSGRLLQHYGMEYNPIAINETLAYSYTRKTLPAATVQSGPASVDTGRFFVELVNTLSAPDGLDKSVDNGSVVNLSGFLVSDANPYSANPYDGACWDLVIGDDAVASRPDPFTGQLQPGATLYGVIPFGRNTISTRTPSIGTSADALVYPLPQSKGTSNTNLFGTGSDGSGGTGPRSLAVFGFDFPGTTESDSEHWTTGNTGLSGTAPFQTSSGNGVYYSMKTAFDVFNGGTPTFTLNPGVLPTKIDGSAMDLSTINANKIKRPTNNGAQGQYYWVYLRRPANPMKPVSAANPMIVVDSMRFPYLDAGGTARTEGSDDGSHKYDNVVTQGTNDLYSYQRLQPYRGGQAVPVTPTLTGAIDPRYGYTEQIAPPTTLTAMTATDGMTLQYGTSGTQNSSSKGPNLSTKILTHSLGLPNHKTTWTSPSFGAEPWAFFPFHDRDFTSPFELTLVPGCAPGLFTKQFIEFAPIQANNSSFLAAAAGTLVTNLPQSGSSIVKPQPIPSGVASNNAAQPFVVRFTSDTSVTPRADSRNVLEPMTFPYLVDKFFYTAAGNAYVATVDTLYDGTASPPKGTVGGYAADGWYRMFEFFEVPSQSAGSIGPVAQGTNFDWARQDVRPGMMNLNLLIDEEAFLALLGQQDMTIANSAGSPSFKQLLMNPYTIPYAAQVGMAQFNGGLWQNADTSVSPNSYPMSTPQDVGYPANPMIVTAANAVGGPAYVQPMPNVGTIYPGPTILDPVTALATNQMKVAFAQFLWMRHGGSGFIFGFGEGAVGQNTTVTPQVAPAGPPSGYLQTLPAERPFRSSSFPDVDYTMLRPAPLPPSLYTDPPASTDPTVFSPGDPGVRNYVRFPGYERSTWAGSTPAKPVYPPPIPARRLFQPSDADTGSNADVKGDSFVNDISPSGAGNPVSGGLPQMLYYDGAVHSLNDDGPNLFISNTFTPSGYTEPDFGRGGRSQYDPGMTQHPYFRGELMQRVLNLSTPRTHQFAVWITVGFFEVIREGDITMIGSPYPAAAFDVMGPEIGAETAQNIRYRSFYIVDRLKLTGYDPTTVGAYRPAVVFRRTIE